jgi:cell division septation protein DedD
LNGKTSGGRPVAWEDAGRQVAPILGSYSALVVTSSDPVAAAHVTLGIARAEAERRRVVVADLVGDLAPLAALLSEDDEHGISDTILYGVSINRVARPVDGTTNLFVVRSGTEQVETDEIFASTRWKRLAESFSTSGGLLLLVARSEPPGLAALIEQLDGAVVVRDSTIPGAPGALILARVASPTKTLKVPFLREVEFPRVGSPRTRLVLWTAAAAVSAALIAGAVVFRARFPQFQPIARSTPSPPATTTLPAPPETLLVAPPPNVTDSLNAAAFAVELLVANTPEGANFVLRRDRASLPAATVAPIPIGPARSTWYKVVVGAFTRRSQADSLLLALRSAKVLGDSAGSVLRVPLALLVDSVESQGGIGDAVDAAVAQYAERGLAVYPLMQNDGGARLYAGAFERPNDAAELLKTLRGAGLQPVLVYRTGRTP